MTNNRKKEIIFYVYSLLIICICVVVDMLLKKATDGKSFGLINGVLSVYSTYNTGGAWSIFNDHTIALTIISALFLFAVVVMFVLYKKKNLMFNISCSLIIAGAMGNLIDRIFLGYVRDFIKLDFMNFPIFNFADMCVCVGVVLLCIYMFFIEKRIKREN